MRVFARIYVLFLTNNQKPPRFYLLILTNKPTLRDSGRLPHSKINNRIYYRPKDAQKCQNVAQMLPKSWSIEKEKSPKSLSDSSLGDFSSGATRILEP